MKYRVIIAGGGPAGLWVAYNLIKKGIKDILVLEKNKVGENSVCGGAVSEDVIKEWSSNIKSLKLVDKIIFKWRNKYYHFKIPHVAIFRREELDISIKNSLGNVVEENVDVLGFKEMEEYVVVYTDKGEFICDYFIIATGPSSHLLKECSLGFHISRNKFAVGERYIVENEDYSFKDRLLFDFSDDLYGYRWIFPFAGGLNIGNGKFILDDKDVLEDLNNFADRMRLPFCKSKVKGAPIPIEFASSVATEKVAVIGDSAGMINPVTGGGLTLSYYFSDKIAVSVEKGKSLKYYERLVLSSKYYRWCEYTRKIVIARNKYVSTIFSLFFIQFKLLSIKRGI